MFRTSINKEFPVICTNREYDYSIVLLEAYIKPNTSIMEEDAVKTIGSLRRTFPNKYLMEDRLLELYDKAIEKLEEAGWDINLGLSDTEYEDWFINSDGTKLF